MNDLRSQFLRDMAACYIWWKTPDHALAHPQRILAQVMNLGLWEDICTLARIFTANELRAVLCSAEAGQFNGRSWAFWHCKLTDCAPQNIPSLPERHLP